MITNLQKIMKVENFLRCIQLFYIFCFIFLFCLTTLPTIHACLQLTENDLPALFCHSTIPALPIPRNDIPINVAKLIISGISSSGQHNGILTHNNLTGLETLTYLQISNFNLKEIESYTFSGMKHLRVLDLSMNQIITIRSEAFIGLSLKLLSLTDNKGIIFDRSSFIGAKVFHLAARNCNLTTLDYETIAEAKPKQLSLSDNRLTWLDPQFSELIIDSTKNLKIHYESISNSPILGYLDLSNNPLNCNCQLVWLSRLVESQSYNVYQYMNSKDLNNKNDLEKDISDWPNSSIRLMYHMNMTCAQPSDLAGKRLPHSWDYFCPLPSITGIEINMLTPNSDLAQLICIGKGRPTPSLAWTYKIHGQKVQQILDPSIKQNFNDQYFLSSKDKSFFNILSNNELIERKLALNISLNSIDIKNFTCTIWNNDKISSSSVLSTSINSLNNITDKLKTTSLIVPTNDNHQIKLQYYRLHEVTVRISGPIRSPEFINTPILNKLSNIDNNKKLSEIDNKKISSIINVQTPMKSIQQDNQDIYSYLFIKRFTLLELLGAIIGTFISTLALLYMATNCFSWFCRINGNISMKNLCKSNLRSNGKLFSWMNPHNNNNNNNNNNGLLLNSGNRQITMNHTNSNHLNKNESSLNIKLLPCVDIETTCTTLTSSGTTPILSQFGSTTISTRRPNIPQALLLTSVPTPRLEANSTPPPNPAYWPMPEYTYSGAGSHEYDVPRPLEVFNGERCGLKPGMIENININPNTAQSFLSLASHSLFPMNSTQLNRNDMGNNPNCSIFQTSANIPPLTMQWTQTVHPTNKTLTINPVIAWQSNLVGSNTSSTTVTDRQSHNSNYTNQPSTQSILYSADYPMYLQTRPYPHHKEQQQQMFEVMTNSTRNYPTEGLTTTPVDILHNHDLPRKSGNCISENKVHMNGTDS